MIAQAEINTDIVREAKTVLTKIYKIIADGHTDKSLDEVLLLANVALDEYSEVSNKGSVVLLKHEPNEYMVQWLNNASMAINMDLQYVLNAYTCVVYVASYIMKTDRAMGVLLKRVASEARNEELKKPNEKNGFSLP